MNVIFRNKFTNQKINLQDFFHYDEDGNIEEHCIRTYASIPHDSSVPTHTWECVDNSLSDILLSKDWEIWCDKFWVNEKQIADLNIIVSVLFQHNDPKILNIANKLLDFINYNELIEKRGGILNDE